MWCPGEGRGRGRCVTSEEVRLDRPASELADCGRPHASRGAALLDRGGPLRGGGEGRGLPLVFGSMSGSRAVRCGVGLRGEAARRVGLRLFAKVVFIENKPTAPQPTDLQKAMVHTTGGSDFFLRK